MRRFEAPMRSAVAPSREGMMEAEPLSSREGRDAGRSFALPALSDIVIHPIFEPFEPRAAIAPNFTQDFARRIFEAAARQFRKF